MNSRWLWVALGLAMAVVALVVEPLTLLPPLRGSWFFDAQRLEMLRWAAAGMGFAVALVPWWRAWLTREPRPVEDSSRSGWSDAGFVAALALMALSIEWRASPVSEDTKFYLGEALDISERGGLGDFVSRCLDGTWAEDNRHPLYLLLLTPWAERTNGMLVASKLVSFAGAALTLLAVLRACRRRGGELAALAGGTLLVTNASFVESSVLTACDSWWTLFAVLAFDLATGDDGTSGRRWLGLGACIGLAFLTKGTGVLLLLSVGLSVLWLERRRSWRALLPLGAGFVATGALLLVRNQQRHGDALFNVNSRRGFWLDRWEQFYDAEALSNASAATWFERHTLGDAFTRLASGFVKQSAHAFEATSVVAPGHFGALFGALGLAVLCLGVLRLADRREKTLLVVLLVPWVASFAWYAQIASDRRFLAVLVPLLAPTLATWTSRARESERRPLQLTLALLSILATLVALVPALRFARPLGFEESSESRAVHAWLHEREAQGRDVVYLLGPSSKLGFDWDRSLLATRVPRPEDDAALERLLASSEGERVRYLIVESDEPAARAGSRWPHEPGREPPGWRLAASFPQESPQVFVYAR